MDCTRGSGIGKRGVSGHDRGEPCHYYTRARGKSLAASRIIVVKEPLPLCQYCTLQRLLNGPSEAQQSSRRVPQSLHYSCL